VNGTDQRTAEIKINAYTLSASHAQNDSLSIGLNLSYLSGRVGESGTLNGAPFANIASGNGVSADFGLIQRFSNEFRWGFSLQNIAGFMWWDDYKEEQLPFGIRTGAAFEVPGYFTFSADWEKHYYRTKLVDSDPILHFGIEQTLGKVIQLRLGMFGPRLNERETLHYSGGLGFIRNSYALSLSCEQYKLADPAATTQLKDVYRYLFSMNIPM
jgi:hypothetical protein